MWGEEGQMQLQTVSQASRPSPLSGPRGQVSSSCDFLSEASLLPPSSFCLPCQACWADLTLSDSQVQTPRQGVSSFPRSPQVPCHQGVRLAIFREVSPNVP